MSKTLAIVVPSMKQNAAWSQFFSVMLAAWDCVLRSGGI
jgi:hypothetical protein